ncbi:MAG: D-arabinono-1,4-lactone oxidase [Bryobacteraceae bacterium]
MSAKRKNWAGNYEYGAQRLHLPHSVEDVRQIVKHCRNLKALGTCHSFNAIADSAGDQISLKNLGRMELNSAVKTVTVGAGVTCGQLAPYLYRHGYALHNLASLPHISLAGAAATATHGSGSASGNLATAVSAIEFVAANGELAALSRERDGERFRGAVVHLGGLGVVTKLTLDLQPAREMRQVVYEDLCFSQLERHFDEIFSAGYSVSLFTDWQHHRATQAWIKSCVDPSDDSGIAPEFFGAKLAAANLHPIPGPSPQNCTEQMGVPGPWHERLPHFRMNFTPSSGEELQTEYFVPRERAREAILELEMLRDRITPHLLVSELRTVAADELWMSPSYRRASATIHFTWKRNWPAVKALLPAIEDRLARFDARPHWAKLFAMAPTRLQSRYERLAAFRELLAEYDPEEKFRNQYLSANLYGGK